MDTMTEVSSTWTDYDGDQPYGDFTAVPGSPTSTITEQRSYELGLATFDWAGGSPDGASLKFYHTDMIGTTRMMTDTSGAEILSAAYTAFGERVTGSANRYGYAGAWGYQTDETEDFPFQHVGARYYNPSTGRFLQRDPIGIRSGTNVYAYVLANPTSLIDPNGLDIAGAVEDGAIGAGVGAIAGAISGAATGASIGAVFGGVGAGPGAVAGAIAGFVKGYLAGAAGGFICHFVADAVFGRHPPDPPPPNPRTRPRPPELGPGFITIEPGSGA